MTRAFPKFFMQCMKNSGEEKRICGNVKEAFSLFSPEDKVYIAPATV